MNTYIYIYMDIHIHTYSVCVCGRVCVCVWTDSAFGAQKKCTGLQSTLIRSSTAGVDLRSLSCVWTCTFAEWWTKTSWWCWSACQEQATLFSSCVLLIIEWWLIVLLETGIQYPCFRVYAVQIQVNLSSRVFEMLPESNRRPRDWHLYALTN